MRRRLDRRGGRAWRIRRSGRFLVTEARENCAENRMRLVPCADGRTVAAMPVERGRDNQEDDNNCGHNGGPVWALANRLFGPDSDFGPLARFKRIFSDEPFFIHAEEFGDGANKAAIENATRKPLPLLVFQCFEEADANARGSCDFLQRDAAHLALALQMLAKYVRCGIHGDVPVKKYRRPWEGCQSKLLRLVPCR